jgi:ABC-2 type transport system ATP-binding protein
MDRGRLVAVDSPAIFKQNFPYRILELKAELRDPDFLTGLPEVLDVEFFGDRYHVRVADAAAGIVAVRDFLRARDIAVTTLEEIPPSFEDIFITLAEEEAV